MIEYFYDFIHFGLFVNLMIFGKFGLYSDEDREFLDATSFHNLLIKRKIGIEFHNDMIVKIII